MGRCCTHTSFSVSLVEQERSVGDVALLPCSLPDRVVNVGKLSLLFLMMLEHNGRACSPKEFLTVRNWGEGSEAGLYIKFPAMQSASGIRRADSDASLQSFQLFSPCLCALSLSSPSLSRPHIPSHFFCMCVAVVQKGDADASFKNEDHTLQEQVIHFKKELQQAHDE